MKKDFNIGDKFSSWKVVECADPKKYRYLCRCIGCGTEKTFIKYHLLNGSYSICKSCAPATIKNINKIRYHWNVELNGTPFTKPQDFDLNRPYWFVCNNFHNFRCSIKDFSVSHCLGCKGKERDSNNKLMVYTVATRVLGAMTDIEEHEDFWIVSRALKFALHITEGDKFSNFRKYFSSENEMFTYLNQSKATADKFSEEGLLVKKLQLENNFEKDIDNFKQSVLYFSQLNQAVELDI
ncbi:hypothetical protein UT300003_32100 [Clostridium sardiniense]